MIDCRDGKDELECQDRLIELEHGYDQNLLLDWDDTDGTRKFGGTVFIEISLKRIQSVDTAQMHFTSNFELWLRWKDPRIKYWNLKTVSSMNRLHPKSFTTVWTPSMKLCWLTKALI